MQILDTLGDWFEGFTGAITTFITKTFGSSNERRIRRLGFARDKKRGDNIVPGSVIDAIEQLGPKYEAMSEEELKQTASVLRARLAKGETLDDVLPDAFAAVREAGWRFLQMKHYPVQLVGGYFLHKGMIAEMKTGEGKTLVATLPAFLNGLAGHVHVITVNDYLALRDMEWMGPVYLNLGLTVGAIQGNMKTAERAAAYACDITYGTNNEFGFDYLRDNMKPRSDLQVQGPLQYAIVDEIDNILVDEARTPLIISGPAHDDVEKYAKADRVVRDLMGEQRKTESEYGRLKAEIESEMQGSSQAQVDEALEPVKEEWHNRYFEVKEKEHTCHLSDDGVRKAEELAKKHGYIHEGESFYSAGNMEWPHMLDNALKAHHLYKRDVSYVVENGEIVIVDEFTGRKMEGRQWSDGLHQAVQAKEHQKVKAENQTLATITLQNFFKLYDKLSGMTGTAMTEAAEFWKVYKLDVVEIPTNKPVARDDAPDYIFLTEKEKWDAVVDEIVEVYETGRPILVGTTSIETSELVSRKLEKRGIKHNVLNAKHHEREAEIVAQAGRKNAVTIATNMAGRGTDIILGGNPEHLAWEELSKTYESRLDVSKAEWEATSNRIAEQEGMKAEGREVAELGGLHVIGTERHDSRRIDLQLRGRSGRQGDPGSTRFFLALDDKLLRLFMPQWIKPMLQRAGMKEGEAIESKMVTRKIEGAQKKVEERHFDQRKHLLEYDEVMDDQRKKVYAYRQRILDGANCRQLILDMIDSQVEAAAQNFLDKNYCWETVVAWSAQVLRVDLDAGSIRGATLEQLKDIIRDEATRQADDQITEQIEIDLAGEDQREWNWKSLSKWANTQFGLNTSDTELKKQGRDGVFQHLSERAVDAIDRYEYGPLEGFLNEDYPFMSLSHWLNQQFTLQVPVDALKCDSVEETVEVVRTRVRELYREKEVLFPVHVAMSRFLSEKSDGPGEKYDREGLVRWANDRFSTKLSVEDFRNRTRDDIQRRLTECSQGYYLEEDVVGRVDDYLDEAFGHDAGGGSEADSFMVNGSSNGHHGGNGAAKANGHAEVLAGMAEWANTEFDAQIDPAAVQTLSRADARREVLSRFDSRYRPELAQAERALILEILDTAWKEHLYHMDHVRSGIGLMGYAQKDPVVEYKREGRRAFNAMWERVGNQVTGAIFRMEHDVPEFVGSLWTVTAVTHAAANDDFSDVQESGGGSSEQFTGTEDQAVDPIVNRMPKVGRNDPCPCGSGKKYKKCHGA